MFDSVRPHRRQPTRPHRPWDSLGKNTGVGCHFLLQCMKVKSDSEVAESCPTLSDPMDCSLPGSSIHGIFQARVLEWGAIAFSVIAATRPLSEILFANTFSQFMGSPFNCLIMSFDAQNFLIYKVPFYILLFCASGATFKIPLPNSRT